MYRHTKQIIHSIIIDWLANIPLIAIKIVQKIGWSQQSWHQHQHETCTHTHTHLTIKHSASNVQLQCFRHPSTPTDGRCSTQTQPLPLTNAYSAMETDDVNRNNCNLLCVSPSVGVNVCFIHAWFKQ